jgi:Putative Actinobacterial Holin-X, holin superfamily III
MHIHASERNGDHGIAAAAREVVDHARAIVKLEVRLALAELRQRLAVAGMGVGLVAGAAVFGFLAMLLLVATVAAAIATALPVWLALLILALACGLFAGVLALTAVQLFKRASPVPKQAIDEARRTAAALRTNGSA